MTLASWKKEFYRVEADAVPEEKALAHSIRKWTGLLKKNLKKHGLIRFHKSALVDRRGEYFWADADSCALCAHYIFGPPRCGECPLVKSRSGIDCTKTGHDEGVSPYRAFYEHGDARPMLRVLKRAQNANPRRLRQRRHEAGAGTRARLVCDSVG